MLAPEAVALEGAAGGVQAFSQAVSGDATANAFDAATTASDLDRIISDHPDAANRPELEQLRDRLNANRSPPPNRMAQRQGSITADLERRAELDRKITIPDSRKRLSSDALVIAPMAKRPRRGDDKPNPFAEPTILEPWSPRLHLLDLTPVRVR
jgi:hypothetical protein